MSDFDAKFKNNVTQAQPIETNEGEWKAHLGQDKFGYRIGACMKALGAIGLGLAVVGAATVASPGAVVLAIMGAVGAYSTGAVYQGNARTNAEERIVGPEKDDAHMVRTMVNIATQFKPF